MGWKLSPTATWLMLLNWSRLDKDDFERGYTAGFMWASMDDLEPWQQMYLRNVRQARLEGISA